MDDELVLVLSKVEKEKEGSFGGIFPEKACLKEKGTVRCDREKNNALKSSLKACLKEKGKVRCDREKNSALKSSLGGGGRGLGSSIASPWQGELCRTVGDPPYTGDHPR